MSSVFPASRIAIALGKTKRAVQLGLQNCEPAERVVVKGQQADAWKIDQLPLRFLQELQAAATSRGYRDAEHLLSHPPRRWIPTDRRGETVVLREISTPQIERASRLLSALSTSLHFRNQLDDSEKRVAALRDFRRHYGPASDRHWRRLLKRTIQRDAGEERFDDLVIYLDDIVTRKPEAREAIAVGKTAADRTVLAVLASVQNGAKPSLDEVAAIWAIACEYVADAVGAGEKQKRVQRRLFDLLSKSRVALARSDSALKKLIKRKYCRWWTGGQTLAALEEQRPHNSGSRLPAPLTESEADLLTAEALINNGGRLARQHWSLRRSGELGGAHCSRYIENPSSKSYVPKSVRLAIAPEVKRLTPIHHGPRENKLSGAYHTRDWSNTAAGDWFSCDDLTPPIYFYQQIDGRTVLMRGQLLVSIDERTTCILGFVLVSAPTYTSAQIFNLFTDVFTDFGLPRRGLVFENGLWRRARLLKGNRAADTNGIADLGLRRLVPKIHHAKLPRAKNIERVYGILQCGMESLPGYCGRNERTDRYERFERVKLGIQAGRLDPREHLLNEEQITAQYERVFRV